MRLLSLLGTAALATSALAHSSLASPRSAGPLILADTTLLLSTGIPILDSDPETGVALAELSPADEKRLSAAAHAAGKCGGFERLSSPPWLSPFEAREFGRQALLQLAQVTQKLESELSPSLPGMAPNPRITSALQLVQESNLRDSVQWLSSFPTRYHRGPNPNAHINPFIAKIQAALSTAPWKYSINTIEHSNTSQQSIRLSIAGKDYPDEIIVLGAHLDSINQSWTDTHAPGADDNASGSSNLLEAARILALQPQPQKTIEFFWYAGEEGGLIGSAEIARTYSEMKKKVLGVLQLDMTLFPGDGELTIGSMTDFTSPALRKWFRELNSTYIGAKIIDDKCGYGCSDHASWHRQGYPTLMPFESSFNRMFPDLHTTRDVIDERSSFKHSAMFTRVAIAFAMELGGY